jgi:hypothetical protein
MISKKDVGSNIKHLPCRNVQIVYIYIYICLDLIPFLFCNSSNSLFLVPTVYTGGGGALFFPSLESGPVVVASLQSEAL